MPMTNKTPTYINADRFISWIDAGHYRSPTEPVFSEQEIVHIIKQQPVCLVSEHSQSGDGCIIEFVTGRMVYMRESYAEVQKMIGAYKND